MQKLLGQYNQDVDLLNRAKHILEKYEGMSFFLSVERYSSNVHHLSPRSGSKPRGIIEISEKYRKLFYDCRGSKRIPDIIFNSPLYVRQSFFMGYYAGDGNRHLSMGIIINNKGEIGSAGLYHLMRTLGYKVSVSLATNNKNVFRLQCCQKYS